MDLASLLQLPPGGLEVALLVLVRISALFVLAPVFGHANIPIRVRVAAAVLVGVLLVPMALAGPRPDVSTPYLLTLAIAGELTVGLTLGFVASLFFHGVQFAGYLLGLQMGFGMNQMYDPTTRNSTTELGVLLSLVATVSFLASNAHHWLLAAIWRSFHAIPLGTFVLRGPVVEKVVMASAGIFDIALTIMLPISGVILVIELALAILNRVIPQMNVFAIGTGAKILLGMTAISATLPLMGSTFDILIDRLSRQLISFF
ncbi:MAG TPA: flagellar biosynthetic protein FliR [Stenomitos sp.]